MKHSLKQLLIEAAVLGKTITYREAANHLKVRYSEKYGGYGDAFFNLMLEIGKEEILANRPPINVLIVNASDQLPGPGFFKWYKKVSGVKFKIRDASETATLAKKLQTDCFTYWSEADLGKILNK